MAKDPFKLINKLSESILQDQSFLDKDLSNNVSILDALIQSGLIPHLSQLNVKHHQQQLGTPPEIDHGVFNCIKAIDVVCVNQPNILINDVFNGQKLVAQSLVQQKQRQQNPQQQQQQQQQNLISTSPQFPRYKVLITNLIKFFKFANTPLNSLITSLIVKVINLLSTKVRSFKVRKALTDFLVNHLISNYLAKSLNNIRNDGISALVIAIHCFDIANNYRVTSSLLLNGSLELKINKFSRKIWYLLNNITPSNEHFTKLLDLYKATFLNNSFNYCIFSGDSISFSKLIICLEFVKDIWHQLAVSSSVSILVQNTLSTTLLELFYECLKRNVLSFLYANLSFDSLLVINDKTPHISNTLIRSVYLILRLDTNNNNVTLNLMDSFEINFGDVLDTPFEQNAYLDDLKRRILELAHIQYSMHKIPKLLNLVTTTNTDSIKVTELSVCDYDKDDYLKQWIQNLESLLDDDRMQIFGSKLSTLKLITSMGKCACLLADHYNFINEECEICENADNVKLVKRNRKRLAESSSASKLVSILQRHFLLEQLDSDILIIELLIALKRIFLKYTLPDINPPNDIIFSFLCKCLYSKNRDIRVFAGKIFPLYLISEDNKNELSNNCSHIFQFLDNGLVLDDNASYLAESKILLWGELIFVLEGEILNVVLVKLFDFFSSTNSFYTCAAYTTLVNVASLKHQTCWQLVNPFLPNLSLTMVKQIVNKSMFGTIIPEFLNVSSNDILFRTITYTVPYLLTYYSKDIIKEIAKIAKVPKYKLIMQELPRVLAVLLTSPEYLEIDDVNSNFWINQDKIMEILTIVDPYFKAKTLSDLIEPVQDIWEICKMYSIEEKNELRIKNAIIYLIKLEKIKKNPKSKIALKLGVSDRYNLSQSYNEDDEKVLHDCFKGSLLGIVQLFSDVVKDARGRTPYVEKLKSLTAIEFLVQISGVEIVTALPQICISLQKSISDPLLEFHSLRCWRILILNLKDIHLSTCFDLIIAIILQRWKHFAENSQKIAKEILIELFNKEDLIKEKFFNYYFTLSFSDELVEVYYKANKILQSKKNLHTNSQNNEQSMVLNLLYDITRRCQNDNKYVVQQALVDLKNFLNKFKQEFHSNFLQKKHFIKFVPILIDILLKNCSKFKSSIGTSSSVGSDGDDDNELGGGESLNIPRECTECLGLIGSLDPNKFEFNDEDEELVCQISSAKELVRFSAQLLNLLVKAFWASEDPGKQIFLAYGMQEFIQLCGIKDISSVGFFNDLTISTLTPLVTSRYELNSIGNRKFNYPLFKLTKNHAEWVRDFTLDLLQKSRLSCANPDADHYEISFYSIYETIIKGQDIAISLSILPYVALNMIIKDYEDYRTVVQKEFMEILNTDCDSETFSHEISKNVKLFYQTIFKILDYLREWIANKKQKQNGKRKRRNLFNVTNEEAIKIVEEFLENIPDLLISKRSSQCASYERAVLYLEQGYRAHLNGEDDEGVFENEQVLSQLREMYDKLDDYDALTGTLRKFSLVNIESAVLQLQYEDNWKSTLGTFEAMSDSSLSLNDDEMNIKYLQYLNKKNLHSEALARLNKNANVITKENKLSCRNIPSEIINVALASSMLEYDVKNLRKWVTVSDIASPINDSELLINLYISKALLSLRDGNLESFNYEVNQGFELIGSSLSLSPTSSLSRNREIINKLHVLEDLKQLSNVKTSDDFQKNANIFKSRFENSGSDFESPWYILTMRKTGEQVLHELPPTLLTNEDISNLWLEKSKIEIDHNRLDLASKSAILSYIVSKNHNAELKYAEILWSQGDYMKALKMVKTLRNLESNNAHQKSVVQLKYANWLESSNNGLSSEIIQEFDMAIQLDGKWEDPHYFLGKYYTKMLESKDSGSKTDHSGSTGDHEAKIIHNYLNSIGTGAKYLQEILPKVITLWLDFSSKTDSSSNAESFQNLTNIEKEVSKFSRALPKYYWFSVFSQLLSRLPSTQGNTFKAVIDICCLVTQYYPEQALWSVFAQFNSDDSKRSAATKKIIQRFIKSECRIEKYSSNKSIYSSASNVFNAFKRMTKVDKAHGMRECSLSEDFRFDHSVVPAPVVVPCKQNFGIASLSSSGFNYNNVTLVKFEDKVKIMSSLQRPRRIEVIGSDGKTYSLLFKLNDDLRKDAKFMDLTSMIDHLLQRNYESKKRNLHINTFAVVPLNESYGIIEWVQNHVTTKSILDKKYEGKEPLLHIKKQYDAKKTLNEKLAFFKYLLKYFKPVLYSWFIEYFPTPSAWYASRNAFVRTSAVMSMVGYVLGVGDRHGENILISQTNGDVLHVDFDCLFEKGLILRIPERVPFRLTHNIVDACGISGVEGTFRQSSEVTMQLLRGNEAILLNILEAFIHDPIMEWKNSKLGSPETTLAKIRAKIRGILEKEALPMSTSGQVNYLIQEATSSEHLCQMYFGWLPFW